MQFSSHAQIEPSATVAINGLAMEKKKRGERVYNLSVGEPMIDTPAVVIEAAIAAMRQGKTHYPPVAGIPELREIASVWMNTTYHTNFSAAQTVVTCGGKFGIFACLQALVEPGDEVVIIAPYWVSYPEMVKLFGGVPKILTTTEENGWKIALDQLQNACTEKTKLIIINNGSNPTGALYDREELISFLRVAQERNNIVLSDEVYSGLVYDGREYVSCGSFPDFQDRVIIIQSCSKHFAMTGWRVGFLFGPEELVKIVTAIQGQSTTGTSIISQYAAVAALEHAQTIVSNVQSIMQTRRNIFVQTCCSVFPGSIVLPPTALYTFMSLTSLGVPMTNSLQFSRVALEQGNVAVVPGVAFGQDGYIRCSFGADEKELHESVEALGNFCRSFSK